ncbi:HAD family phosphatase [Bacteroides sp. 519]|uniref:HAD family hydrolase n=1 Tax=Bacteroides sp. 519 TaxID=2302937 RepID=UPI0013D6EF53|nr:HAD family phosphatase [Bacteroides sp. 519]NDV56613.1 HAD family phosphatase [Bacteroides sp. 519]
MIKNIVFDLGGVIMDINRESAVKRFEELGITNAEELLDKYHQKGIFLEVEDGRIDADGFCRKLSELANRELSFEDAKYGWLGFITGVPLYRLHYMEELRKKYNLYLLSNTNPFIMSWARSKDFNSEGKPLDYYFDKLYLSYQVGVVKPDKGIFDYLIKDASINPAESVFVDDGSANIKMGKELGFEVMQPINGEDWRGRLDEILLTI